MIPFNWFVNSDYWLEHINRTTTLYEITEEVKREIDLFTRNSQFGGIATGFSVLDSMLLGFHPQELTVLTGRPGCGKTALMLNLMRGIVDSGPFQVLLFSPVMHRNEIHRRFLGMCGEVDMQTLRAGPWDCCAYKRILQGFEALNATKIFVNDVSNISPGGIEYALYHAPQAYLNRIVFIDSLEHIDCSEFQGDRHAQWYQVLSWLHRLAREFNVSIMTTTSLRGFQRHHRCRARQAIERNAQVVLHLRELCKDSQDRRRMRLSVLRQRNGLTGDIDLLFEAPFQRFTSESSRVANPGESPAGGKKEDATASDPGTQ